MKVGKPTFKEILTWLMVGCSYGLSKFPSGAAPSGSIFRNYLFTGMKKIPLLKDEPVQEWI